MISAETQINDNFIIGKVVLYLFLCILLVSSYTKPDKNQSKKMLWEVTGVMALPVILYCGVYVYENVIELSSMIARNVLLQYAVFLCINFISVLIMTAVLVGENITKTITFHECISHHKPFFIVLSLVFVLSLLAVNYVDIALIFPQIADKTFANLINALTKGITKKMSGAV